jgi:hypothetical protein
MNITEYITNLKDLRYRHVNEEVMKELLYVIMLSAAKITWRW